MSSNCRICGEPMPEGEEMFKFHGYSGNCPKPPLKDTEPKLQDLLEIQVDSEDIHGNKIKISPEFRVAVQEIDSKKGVHIIIHANGHNSDTLDCWVKDNKLTIID